MALDFPASPTDGQTYQQYIYDATAGLWNLNNPVAFAFYPVEFLAIGGGGGGGVGGGGGGGAGGHLEANAILTPGTEYTVTIGAGGSAPVSPANYHGLIGNPGIASRFGDYYSPGGGGGSGESFRYSSTAGISQRGQNGASGGGAGGGRTAGGSTVGGAGIVGLGNNGGGVIDNLKGGGGGGAGAAGTSANASIAGDGGDGLSSSITGTPVTRAGGGGGGGNPPGSAGAGGGAPGAIKTASSATANTGGGGGGAGDTSVDSVGGAGGSGIVIVKYPATAALTIGVGLTASTTTVGDYKVTTFTAGTDTVTIGAA